MKNRTGYIFLLFLISLGPCMWGQVKVGEFVQASKLAEPGDDKLIFIDFWATWCKPCIHVSKYVETLQEQFANDFYAISLTKESKDIVTRFLPKHPSRLAIALDSEGETFLRHGITTLPYGVLYNTAGDEVWKGHPADLTASKLSTLIRRNRNKRKKGFEQIVRISGEGQSVENTLAIYRPEKPVEVFPKKGKIGEEQMYEQDGYVYFSGKLKGLVSRLKGISPGQVDVHENRNDFVEVYALGSLWEEAPDRVLREVYEQMGISEHILNREGEAYRLIVEDPSQLWDDKQIDWGRDSPRFLVDDMQIQADNVTFTEFMVQLSTVTGVPVVSDFRDTTLRDWKLQYRFFELMQNQLYDTYSIRIVKEMAIYEVVILK